MGDHLELFKFWIEQGWKYRLSYDEHMKTHVAKYKSRLKHEVDMIVEKNFVDYFLIVSDLIRWAKDHDIAVGPGRGSSAGSLVCYLLRITEINPMLYPMLFERFLDPTRNDEPDIDIDFESDRRDEVFVYATNKYGHEYVANILNFTRYLGRSSLDDIERVYHLPKWKIEAFKSKLLERPEGHPRFSNSIEDTINTFSEIRELVAEQPEIGYAIRLEGNIRNFNVHAAGMVVSAVPLAEICATYEREINGVVRQGIPYDKRGAAYVGLLKIDALSLITMGEIAAICKAANMNLLDLYRVPLDDEQTLKAFRDGDIMGIFQFEGITTRRILKAVQPTTFMHLADVNALARPGADDKQYIANKNSGDEIAYIHPIMREHLDWTYGTVVYEEQILMILRDLGGFAPAELNKMRKVIHDKLGSSQFNVYYERFVKGCAAHGLSEDTARKIWDGLVSASGYAFNIAHSVSYAHIGFWQQYLKIHFPAEFYTQKLTKCPSDDKGKVRRGKFIQEAGRHGIDVLPPNLLHSGYDWTLTEINGVPTILAGFEAIDGIGPKTTQNIINWRKANEEEFGMDDFFPEWEDLIDVKGIGQKTIDKILDFVQDDDPFGVQKVAKTLKRVRALDFLPRQTHISIDLPKEPERVCYIGILRRKKYYDAVEQLQKRTTGELSYDDALQQIKDPHLLKYATLEVEDEYGEVVKVSVNRWDYPKLAQRITKAKINRDVVVAQGLSSDFGGISIRTKNLTVINPEYQEGENEY